ncbi:hypothetical protein A9Q80_01010 [Cycloclasticus sp. 46_83_sub15_T18]|nr:hypothetical protein A9Q80_01010 [Cycloclasticus sp. 46_83_sub15_T18]
MRLIVLLFVMLTVGICHAEVYKYINKQGKTAYSDIPVAGAKKVVVPPVMIYKAPAVQSISPIYTPSVEAVSYQRLEIINPIDQAIIRNNLGKLSVNYRIEPSLQRGDRLLLLLDGVRQESMNIEGLVRGQHSLSLEVVNAKNELRMSSATTVIYLQHATRLN